MPRIPALNDKFCEDNFRSEQSAATYGEETIQASTAQLERLDQGGPRRPGEAAQGTRGEGAEVRRGDRSKPTLGSSPRRSPTGRISPCSSRVDSCLNQAKSQLRSEFSCSYTISERISAEIANLDALRPTREAHQSDGEAEARPRGPSCWGMPGNVRPGFAAPVLLLVPAVP